MNFTDPIQNELNELNSILAGVPKTNVYTVPDGYFEATLNDILSSANQSIIHGQRDSVPDGYFEGLADSIMSKIRAGAESTEQSSLLHAAKGINVYKIPAGFFNEFPDRMIHKINMLDEESILLAAAKEVNVYKVPAGYFNQLPARSWINCRNLRKLYR